MAGFSGKFATARISGGATIIECLGWTFTPKAAVPKWASNVTSGFKTGVAGVEDSSGKIEVKADDAVRLPFRPGDVVLLELHMDGTNLNFIRVNTIMEELPIEVKIDPDGEPPTYTYNFQGIGAPVYFGLLAPGTGSSGI